MGKVGRYKMNTITQKTGFSPALLRAWERRHGLLAPERTEGGHRLYTDDDLAVLERVREFLSAGRAIGEVASLGRKRLLTNQSLAPAQPAEPVELPADLEGQVASWTRGLVEAAVTIDEGRAEQALDQAFGILTPSMALERVVLPALVTIGDLWAQGRCTVAGEHLASAKVIGRLLKLLQTVNPPVGTAARTAVSACLPDEQHEVGSLMAACTLAHSHYRVSYLGACLPLEDLERTCTLLAPDVVCLSVSRAALLMTHKPRLAEFAQRLPKTTRLFLGGRGVTDPDRELSEAGFTLLTPEGPTLEQALLPEALTRKKPAKKTRARRR